MPPTYLKTNEIISDAHAKNLYSGVNATITAVRQLEKKQLRHCMICRKLEGTAFKAPDPLPKVKVQEAPPFAVTSVDFAQHLYVRGDRGHIKCYICLPTFALTRAVHLEAVPDLTECIFLQAFRCLPGANPYHW